ncbi:hypothetical protein [Humisphaera borealis]|uniref:Transmembrane protein n=1 Tax=Humisphaera borealis TaxID=2807512 RepID=A0A7M2WPT5_9BACT|nr:hypothetical protein [Humisphaera borealis]QOV87537.1 hypothetical protein IPV69_14695 [Humisphaera borealis]
MIPTPAPPKPSPWNKPASPTHVIWFVFAAISATQISQFEEGRTNGRGAFLFMVFVTPLLLQVAVYLAANLLFRVWNLEGVCLYLLLTPAVILLVLQWRLYTLDPGFPRPRDRWDMFEALRWATGLSIGWVMILAGGLLVRCLKLVMQARSIGR